MTALPANTDLHVRRVAAPRATIAFITGCGRSGTTVLGRLLSKHLEVTYLNDQHMLWAQIWPAYDITGRAPFDPSRPAPLELAAHHAASDPAAAARFHAAVEERRDGRRLVVEKITHNNMRMPFLRALAPDCLIINIARHGIEVARSIARRIELGRWYGPRDRKWACIEAHARQHGHARLLPLCADPVSRGLLEWRLSVDAADQFLEHEDSERTLRLRYEDLIAEPVRVCEQLERFLGLTPRPVMREFAATQIARLSPPAHEAPTPPPAEDIAGPALRRLGYWPGSQREAP